MYSMASKHIYIYREQQIPSSSVFWLFVLQNFQFSAFRSLLLQSQESLSTGNSSCGNTSLLADEWIQLHQKAAAIATLSQEITAEYILVKQGEPLGQVKNLVNTYAKSCVCVCFAFELLVQEPERDPVLLLVYVDSFFSFVCVLVLCVILRLAKPRASVTFVTVHWTTGVRFRDSCSTLPRTRHVCASGATTLSGLKSWWKTWTPLCDTSCLDPSIRRLQHHHRKKNSITCSRTWHLKWLTSSRPENNMG